VQESRTRKNRERRHDRHDTTQHELSRTRSTRLATAPTIRAASSTRDVEGLSAEFGEIDITSETSSAGPTLESAGIDALLSPSLHRASSGGAGAPLPPDVRSFMEPWLGADLGHVRTHYDDQAAELARSLDAAALTIGSHVFFGPGTAPDVSPLTAHELTHAVQHDRSQTPPTLAGNVAMPNDYAEREAGRAAEALSAGEASPGVSRGAGAGLVHRAPATEAPPAAPVATPPARDAAPPAPLIPAASIEAATVAAQAAEKKIAELDASANGIDVDLPSAELEQRIARAESERTRIAGETEKLLEAAKKAATTARMTCEEAKDTTLLERAAAIEKSVAALTTARDTVRQKAETNVGTAKTRLETKKGFEATAKKEEEKKKEEHAGAEAKGADDTWLGKLKTFFFEDEKKSATQGSFSVEGNEIKNVGISRTSGETSTDGSSTSSTVGVSAGQSADGAKVGVNASLDSSDADSKATAAAAAQVSQKGGVSGSATVSQTYGDENNAKGGSGTIGYNDGKVTVGGDRQTVALNTDDKTKTATTTGATVSVGTDGQSIGGTMSQKTETKTNFDVEGERKREAEAEKAALEAAQRKAAGVEEPAKKVPATDATTTTSTNKASASYDAKEGMQLGASNETSTKRPDGSGTGSTAGGTMGVNTKGEVSLGATGSKSFTNAGGDTTAATGNASFNTSTGEATVGGGLKTTDKEGKNKGSISGTGTVDFRKDGSVEGMKGQVTAGIGQRSISLGGGWKATLDDPVEMPNTQWGVRYTRAYEGSLGGANASDSKFGETGTSASVSAGVKTTETGVKFFATKEEAVAFHAAGNLGVTAVPNTAEAALGLKPGETMSEIINVDAGGKGGGSTGGVNLEVGLSTSGSRSTTVEGGADGIVFAEVAESDKTTKSASVGNMVSMGGSLNQTGGTMVRLSFDLKTEQGKEAFNAFRATGKIPESGCTRVAERRSDGGGSSKEVGAFGLKMGDSSQTEESTTKFADGRKEEASTGTHGESVSLPFVDLKHGATTSMTAVEVNDRERYYTTTTDIDSSLATDANQALALGTSTSVTGDLSGKSSGKWKVTSGFSQQQMDKFLHSVESGQYDPMKLTNDHVSTQTGAGDALKKAIAEAGNDPDKKRQALAQFVADGGHRALDQIRLASGESPEHFLELAGDKNFKGIQGRVEIEGKVSGFEKRLVEPNADGAALAAEIDALANEQRVRINNLDPTKYPDLPRELRAREVDRSQRDIERLEGLKKRALDQAKVNPAPVQTPTDASTQPPPAPEVQGELTTKRAAMLQAKTKANAARDTVAKSRWLHEGNTSFKNDYSAMGGAARDKEGDEGIVFGIGAGAEHGGYVKADADWSAGEARYQSAKAAENKSLTLPETTDEQIRAKSAELSAATDAFEQARQKFVAAEAGYQGIYSRLKGKGYFTAHYDKEVLPEGMRSH
jgi:hypothetical protein